MVVAVVVVPVVVVMVMMVPVVMAAMPAGEIGRKRREAMLVELMSQDLARLRPAVDVEGGVRSDASVVDEHPNPMMPLGPSEQPVREAPPVVVVPGRVLADHEGEVAPVAVEVLEGRPDPRRRELRVDVGAHPVDETFPRPVGARPVAVDRG